MSGRTIDLKKTPRRYTASLSSLLCILVLSGLMASYHASTKTFYTCESNKTTITDYYYHLKVFQHYWSDTTMSPYSTITQTLSLVSVCSHIPQKTLPVGLSPAAVIGMHPLTVLDYYSPRVAFGGWLFLSFLIFLTGLFSILQRHSRFSPLGCLVIESGVIATPLVQHASMMGQFSIFGTGLLLHLLSHTQSKAHSYLHHTIVFLILLCLSAKPTYYVLGLTLLLGMYPIQRYIHSMCGVTFITFALLPQVMGLWSFYDQITFYLNGSQSGQLAVSFLSFNQATAIGAIRQLLGLELPQSISAAMLSALCAASLIVRNPRSPIVCLGAFLVFIPYLGFYDDAIALIFLCLIPASSEENATRLTVPLISILLVLIIFLAPADPLIRLWGKCFLVLIALSLRKLSPALSNQQS